MVVFAAVRMGWLVGPYLLVLEATTFIYVGLIAPATARQSTTVVDRQNFLTWPDPKSVAREVSARYCSANRWSRHDRHGGNDHRR